MNFWKNISAPPRIDEREVTSSWERKSLGAEETFERDLIDVREIEIYLRNFANSLFDLLNKEGKRARTVTLKIKYHDFRSITRRRTLEEYIATAEEIFEIARELLARTDAGRIRIRLAGISLSTFSTKENSISAAQLDFPNLS